MKDLREFAEWCRTIETTISSSIKECHPREWNEDHISYTWLKAMRKVERRISLRRPRATFSIAWDAYKVDGPVEESNGDIAFLIKQTFKNRTELTGVAFLEAKRMYENTNTYEKISWSQLSKQNINSSSHQLLLYDYEVADLDPLQNSNIPLLFPYLDIYSVHDALFLEMWRGMYFQTYACVCPSRQAIAYRTRARKLHELCIPLGYQIYSRYFFGKDLDYNAQLVADVANGVKGGVGYLIAAQVSFAENVESSVENITFNQDAYSQLVN